MVRRLLIIITILSLGMPQNALALRPSATANLNADSSSLTQPKSSPTGLKRTPGVPIKGEGIGSVRIALLFIAVVVSASVFTAAVTDNPYIILAVMSTTFFGGLLWRSDLLYKINRYIKASKEREAKARAKATQHAADELVKKIKKLDPNNYPGDSYEKAVWNMVPDNLRSLVLDRVENILQKQSSGKAKQAAYKEVEASIPEKLALIMKEEDSFENSLPDFQSIKEFLDAYESFMESLDPESLKIKQISRSLNAHKIKCLNLVKQHLVEEHARRGKIAAANKKKKYIRDLIGYTIVQINILLERGLDDPAEFAKAFEDCVAPELYEFEKEKEVSEFLKHIYTQQSSMIDEIKERAGLKKLKEELPKLDFNIIKTIDTFNELYEPVEHLPEAQKLIEENEVFDKMQQNIKVRYRALEKLEQALNKGKEDIDRRIRELIPKAKEAVINFREGLGLKADPEKIQQELELAVKNEAGPWAGIKQLLDANLEQGKKRANEHMAKVVEHKKRTNYPGMSDKLLKILEIEPQDDISQQYVITVATLRSMAKEAKTAEELQIVLNLINENMTVTNFSMDIGDIQDEIEQIELPEDQEDLLMDTPEIIEEIFRAVFEEAHIGDKNKAKQLWQERFGYLIKLITTKKITSQDHVRLNMNSAAIFKVIKMLGELGISDNSQSEIDQLRNLMEMSDQQRLTEITDLLTHPPEGVKTLSSLLNNIRATNPGFLGISRTKKEQEEALVEILYTYKAGDFSEKASVARNIIIEARKYPQLVNIKKGVQQISICEGDEIQAELGVKIQVLNAQWRDSGELKSVKLHITAPCEYSIIRPDRGKADYDEWSKMFRDKGGIWSKTVIRFLHGDEHDNIVEIGDGIFTHLYIKLYRFQDRIECEALNKEGYLCTLNIAYQERPDKAQAPLGERLHIQLNGNPIEAIDTAA